MGWRRSETGDRFDMGNGSRVTIACFSQIIRSSQIAYCYTCGLFFTGATQGELPEGQEKVPWGITVSRNSLVGDYRQHLRIRRLILFIFAGAVYNNALTNCATRSCCACVDLITCVADRYLTLRTGCEKHGRKNPLPFPIFEAVTYRKSAPD